MTMRMLGRTLLLLSLISLFPTLRAHSADIDIKDYWMNTVGQWYRYSFSYPPGFPGFTATLTVEKSGAFVGKYRGGDFITPDPSRYRWVIFDWDATNMNLYATPAGNIDPPAHIPRVMPLETLIDNPLETDVSWYFIKVNSFTVPGGTFQDVLVWFNLDKKTKPNSVNAIYGLSGFPYGITGVEWYGRGVGELQELDVDAYTGGPRWLFILQAYGFTRLLPPYLLLLE